MVKYTIYYAGKTAQATGIVKARAVAMQMMLEGNYRHQDAYILPGLRTSKDFFGLNAPKKSRITIQPKGQYPTLKEAMKHGYLIRCIDYQGHNMYPWKDFNLDGTIVGGK